MVAEERLIFRDGVHRRREGVRQGPRLLVETPGRVRSEIRCGDFPPIAPISLRDRPGLVAEEPARVLLLSFQEAEDRRGRGVHRASATPEVIRQR